LLRPASRSAAARAASATALDVATLGPYRVGRLLGEGGMANVYRGEDIGLGRQVALKVIKDEYANDADFVVRFLNEARAVAKVSHPNVVTVYYAGSDAGKHFFAMEYLAGPDLEALVEEGGRMEERQALTFGVQAACGLASAAAQGLVHCDVKPSNLMCYAGGLVKVTDFGISRAISATAAGADPLVMGTPWFMSPEQVVGGAVDFRSDIYALGATLYYLLVGVVPYEGDDMIEVALRQVHDPVPTPPGVSRKAARLVTRMMAKAPEARFSSYDELISEIRRLI
jgi:serine/threonine-protein kinase